MQIKDLYRYGQKVTIRRGEIITDAVAGSDEASVYILDKGLAALTSTNKKGDEFIYLFFRGPRCIGFAPAVTQMLNLRPFPMSMHQPTMFTILAKSDCSLYRISRANFQALMEDPDFSKLLINIIFSTYMDVLYHYYTSRESSAAGRLCGLLLEQSEKDADGELVLDSLFTYDELSHYLGVHNITVARIMSALKKEGVIRKLGRKTLISDMTKLRSIIDEDLILEY